MLQSVGLVLLALSGSTFAVIAHLRAIHGTPLVSGQGAARSRGGAVAGGTLTVPSPAPGDLSTRAIHHGAVRGKLTITVDADLIALGCCQVPSASTHVTTNSRAGTAHDAFATFTRVALAHIEREVVQATVATSLEVAVACLLVHI